MTVSRQPSCLVRLRCFRLFADERDLRGAAVKLLAAFGVLALMASCGSGGQQSSYVVCVQCVANSDCTTAAQPICDTASHTCVGCAKSGDCVESVPVCDLASHTCVGCTSDHECASITPHCDLATETCVACVDNTGCTSAAAPVCDLASHTCVGCVDNSGCTTPTTYCNLLTHTCENPDAGAGTFRGIDAGGFRG
jgi:hypothetical protein